MFLSDTDIVKYIDDRMIIVTPNYNPDDLRQAGLRVHLSNTIYEQQASDEIIDIRDQNLNEDRLKSIFFKQIDLKNGKYRDAGYILQPNCSVIASTVESFKLSNNLFVLLDGRSTLARFGITVHISAAIVDSLNLRSPKSITLEIFNLGRFKFVLYPNMPIAMAMFGLLSSDSNRIPSMHYIGSEALPNVSYIQKNRSI